MRLQSTLNASRRHYSNMVVDECTVPETLQYIKDLKNKATSDTAIRPLKYVSKNIAPIIQHLITSSLHEGVFPDILKCAKVIPLHKSSCKTNIANYRPISLLSCFSKLFEKAMHKRLSTFLESNNLIYNSQFGFRSGHSCEYALLDAQNSIINALDKKQIAALLLIDFSKAFDMVDHDILLSKLEHYGIRGLSLEWFKSYLIDRQQYVHVNGHNSAKSTLKYGVPQGSILGPLLFIVYINDLPHISSIVKFILYADDANIILTGYTYTEIQNKIEILLTELLSWVNNNGLKLNIEKNKYMIFSNKKKQDLDIKLNGIKIERSSSEKL